MKIRGLPDFVIFLGIFISCTLTQEIFQCRQNLGVFWFLVFLSWCLFGLGGPEKCSFIFYLFPLLGKIVGSWERTVLHVEAAGASIFIFLS